MCKKGRRLFKEGLCEAQDGRTGGRKDKEGEKEKGRKRGKRGSMRMMMRKDVSPLSGLLARLLELFPPVLASALIIHQLDLPVPSFCTRMNLLCRERLCRIEFWGGG